MSYIALSSIFANMLTDLQLKGVSMIFGEQNELIFVQKKEFGELLGFETRNKFQVLASDKTPVAYAAEENTGVLGFLARQILGHWRSFNLHFFDMNRNQVLIAKHPFRIYFERLEVYTPDGVFQGALEKRFSILSKKFDVLSPSGKIILKVNSPLWRLWTFRFMDLRQSQVAMVEKKWGGVLKEFFLDADTFKLSINSSHPSLDESLRNTLVASSLFIDLQYFERKAR